VWRYYDDLRERRIDAEKPGEDILRMLRRYVLFLESDLPFEWPSAAQRLARKIPGLRLLFTAIPKSGEGDRALWPFYRRTDWEQAVARAVARDTSIR
jgi:hypothetical protein